jgi:GTP:adenosylcobinamide-phosphate guanylyltransferase
MDAVVMAGGIPQPSDPLYSYSNGGSKALIDIAGRPMIQWVLDALTEAKSIDRVVVIGLSEKTRVTFKKPIHFLSNQGRLLDNLKAGTAKVMEINPRARYVLFVSADIPAITGEMVDWVVNTCLQTKDDLYYNVIRREAMESRFPTSRRTYTPLKDMQLCGGDLNMARTAIVNENSAFWSKLLNARKNPAAQALLIGWDIIFKFVFHQLTIDDVIQRVADKLGIKGRAIICPFPEIGMDVDKPHQLEIMRHYLARKGVKVATGTREPPRKAGRVKSSAAKSRTVSNARPARKRTTSTNRRRPRKSRK